MYLVDTDVISEARKGERANRGVRDFFQNARQGAVPLYLSAVSVGELRQGVEAIRIRGDVLQAGRLERWLMQITSDYAENILAFDEEIAQIWGCLRDPHPENPLEKQIAATAMSYASKVRGARNVP